MARKLQLLFVALLSSISLSQASLGQAPDPKVNNGLVVGGGTYQGGVQDDVNLSSGKLTVTIPILHLPGRNEHDIDLSLTSNTGDWKLLPIATGNGLTEYDYVPDGDASLTLIADPIYLGSGIYIPDSSNQGTPTSNGFLCSNQVGIELATGATYAFPGVVYNCSWNGTTDPVQARLIGRGREAPIGMDSAGAGIVFNGTDPSHITYKFPDGRVITFINTGNYLNNTITDMDANGNVITYKEDGSIIDTVGRVLSFANTTQDPGGFTLSYKDPNGKSQQVVLAIGKTAFNCGAAYFDPPIFESSLGNYGGYSYPTDFCEYTRTLTLPNGSLYQFLFDNYGELSKVQYPTGGYTRYEYDGSQLHEDDTNDREIRHKFVCPAPSGQPGQSAIADGNTCPVTEQETSYDPLIPKGSFTAPAGSYSYSNTQNIVTTPDGTKTTYLFGASTPSEYVDPNTGITEGYSPSSSPELSHTVADSTGKILRTVAYSPSALLPSSVTTTLEDGSMSQTQTDYIQTAIEYNGTAVGVGKTVGTFPQIKETRDYDYGTGSVGALLRKTDYTWSSKYTTTDAYMPTLEATKIVTDPSGLVSQSEKRFYDEQSPTIAAAISHQAGINMGNLTTDMLFDDHDNLWLTLARSYDDSGNVITAYDALRHPTTYSYADVFSESTCAPQNPAQPANAYATSVTSGGLTETSTYSSCGGQKTQSTDANQNPTTYTYDMLARPLFVTRPDVSPVGRLHGSTTYCYSDSPGPCNSTSFPLTVQQSTIIDTSQSLTSTDTFDGLGRSVSSVTANAEDPKSSVYTDTTYDVMGRTQSRSNPHFVASAPTDGTTSYAYDALGRPMYQCQPDNGSKTPDVCIPGLSFIKWSYAGDLTTETDENGHTRQTVADALGREVQVREPDSANNPTIVTDYKYNPNNQVIRVDQWGAPEGGGGAQCYSPSGVAVTGSGCDRVRQFTYDSLARLIQRQDPESGTSTFRYVTLAQGLCSGDPSKLCTHTDARGVASQYSYDTLNRVTAITYSSDPNNTAAKMFTYDTPNAAWSLSSSYAQTNLKGRLSSASTSDGKTEELFGYDTMGRLTAKSVCTPNTCGADHYDMSFSYDLAGDLTSQGGGVLASQSGAPSSGGFNYSSVALSYNSLQQLVEADADPAFTYVQHPATLVSSLVYNPLGAISGAQLGTNDSQSTIYTNRGRISTRMSSDTVTTGILTDQWNYDFHGNITSLSDSSAGSLTYTYDSLNRLTSTTASGAADVVYSVDVWGNLYGHSTSAGFGLQAQFNVSTLNQLIGFGYDAAGNMTSDGIHQYTYNGDDQIVSVDGSVSYTYDALGQRVATGSIGQAGATFEFLYDDAGRMITTVGSDKRLVRRQLTFGGVHWGDYAGPTTSGNDLTEYRLNDQVGTLYTNVDLYGNPLEGCLAASFGEGLTCSGSIDYTETHFADQKRDQETTLDYMGARYYSSALARFTSPDSGVDQNPDDPQSWNLYSYVGNNPLSNNDPTGHQEQSVTQKCFKDRFDNSCDYELSTSITVHADLPPDPTLFRRDYISLIPKLDSRTFPYKNPFAPSNQKPSFLSCTFNAKTGKALGTTALDAVGIIPGGGNVLHAIQFGAAVGAAGVAVYGSVRDAGLSATGAGLAIADKTGVSIAVHGAEVIPILGNAISAVATGFDIFGEGGVVDSYTSCLAGTHP